ncbi:MAG: hypothetical protein EBR91_05975 [Flavobacteriia bacterium]|nr:hypothetical protein [Flavobacteriia bacterium]NBV91697.1 hypothetical protein [Flavobacteriia bacterium]NBY39756.1 hypothetical protein [Flavobacteriia bacterium]
MIKNEFYTKHIGTLKKKIELKLGFAVLSYHDCKKVTLRLKQDKISISPLTIARIFNLVNDTKRPYHSTLDLLTRFLGYESFSSFCIDTSDLVGKRLFNPSFEIVNGSFQALELACQQADWKMVKFILDEINPHKDDYEFPMFLGNIVRNHPQRNAFIKALMEVEVGRVYFFERFVDEDDPDGYFSNALTLFCSNYRRDIGSQIFKICFQLAKQIYQENKFDVSEWRSIDQLRLNYKELHFHQISRWFELKILFASLDFNPLQKAQKIVEEILEILPKFNNNDQCWIIARPLKALAHIGLLYDVLGVSEIKEQINNVFVAMDGRISSIGDLIVQFVCHAFVYNHQSLSNPKSISSSHFNETYSRIAIESATSLLYVQDPVKTRIEKNLRPFVQKTGNSWVLNIIK